MTVRQLAAAVVVVLLSAAELHAHEGWGIVVHDRLGVVFSDIPGNTIWRIRGDRVEPLFRDIHSHALILHADHSIYGTNPDPAGDVRSIWRVDPTGRFSYVVAPTSASPLGLQSFLIAGDGSIYTANRYDHRKPTIVLLRRDPAGRIDSIAGGAIGFRDGAGAAAQFLGIDGIREASDGTLVVADGPYLRSVSRSGVVATLTRPLTERQWGEDLLGLSSIHRETVHVADLAGRRILRVSLRDGQAAEVNQSSWLWAPAGVEQNEDDLYVLEHLRPPLAILGDLQIGPYLRVRRLAGGQSTTLAVIWGRRTAPAAAVGAVLVLFAGLVVRWWLYRRRRTGAPHPRGR